MSVPRDYDIVATLGPATAQPEAWRALKDAGASRFRLNTSHLDRPGLTRWLAAYADRMGHEVPLVLDLQGSKWRIGAVAPRRLEAGERVVLELDAGTGAPRPAPRISAARIPAPRIPVPHRDFFAAAEVSDGRVLLNDARVELDLEDVDPAAGWAGATVTVGGPVAPAKGITLPGTRYRKESLNEKDRRIVEETRDLAFVQIAVSYVRDGAEMTAYRREIGVERYVIAKIERPPAVADIESIGDSAEELWVCRGDLGAEAGLAGMAAAVREISGRVGELSVPCLMAGQVLEHMTGEAQPTRAEVVQLYDLLADGFAGVVLSDETAVGSYPVEACRTAAMFRRADAANEAG